MKVLKLDMTIRDSNAREWVAVAIFAAVAIILSIWGLVEYNNQNKNQKDYSISLAGHPTFSNNYITALVESSQIIKVYGLNNESGQDRILLTSMFGKTKDIDSSNVRYQVYPKTSQSLAEPIGVKLEISNTEPGLFEGLIMVLQMGNNTILSIPITVTSDTVTNFAVIWILVGVFSSLVFWEIIRIKKKEYTKTSLSTLDANRTKITAADTSGLVENVLARQNRQRVLEYLDNRYSRAVDAGKVFFLNVVTVIFGMAVGFIGLLNNDYVTSIRTIDFTVLVVLIGIGLGIGSIKELVDKPD